MLGSRFLKSEHETRHGLLYRALEGGFDLLLRWYEWTLRSLCASALLRWPWPF